MDTNQAVKAADARQLALSGQLAADEGLGREEVFRRLRALKQPVTLFGEVLTLSKLLVLVSMGLAASLQSHSSRLYAV